MSILLVGDLHLDSQTPISRIDDYREATIRKLNALLKLALENKSKAVITAGDFFDKYYVPISYLNEVIEVLKLFKDNNIEFYSLIGNHDLPHDKMRYFGTTPLSLLYKSGLVLPIENKEYVVIGNTKIYGINFTEIESAAELNERALYDKGFTRLLVMHYATDNTIPNESISRTALSNFDYVLSGHDHTPYGLDGKSPVMLRPGSFTRRTKDDYNINRDNIIVYKLNESTGLVMELSLPNVEKAEFIFSVAATQGISKSLLDSLKARFTGDFFKAEAQDIFSILDDLRKTNDTILINRIESELAKAGIAR